MSGRDLLDCFKSRFAPYNSQFSPPMSAAPYTQSSIPTPPFSPTSESKPMTTADMSDHHPLKSTLDLLDALVAFYQHERMWVSTTRTALENASKDAQSPEVDIGQDSLPSPVSDSPHEIDSLPHDASSDEATKSQHSRWHHRKRGFKLKLEGAARQQRAATLKPVGLDAPLQQNIPQREQILDMFEKMMEARMESCQRINRLVRNANRADLHHR